MDGFKNIPVDELRERINEIEKGKPVYLICQSGLRSYIASRILEGNGYETYNFSGGFRFYDAVVNDRLLRSYAICPADMKLEIQSETDWERVKKIRGKLNRRYGKDEI